MTESRHRRVFAATSAPLPYDCASTDTDAMASSSSSKAADGLHLRTPLSLSLVLAYVLGFAIYPKCKLYLLDLLLDDPVNLSMVSNEPYLVCRSRSG